MGLWVGLWGQPPIFFAEAAYEIRIGGMIYG